MKIAIKTGAALAVMLSIVAFFGVTSALADKTNTLCNANGEACRKANYAGEAFTATSEATFNFGELGTVKCSSTMLRTDAEPNGVISSLTFTGCSEGCTIKATNLPAAAVLEPTTGGNGNMIFGFNLGVLCGGIECAYETGGYFQEFKGGNPASIPMNRTLKKTTGSFLCPKAPKWEAVYKITSPASAVYILKKAKEGPVFCNVNENPCLQTHVSSTFTLSLQKSTSFKITKLVGGVLTCATSKSTFTKGGQYLFEPGPWLYNVQLLSCTNPTYTSCSVSRVASEYAYLIPSTGGNGEIVVKAGETGVNPGLLVKCSSAEVPFECEYSTEEFSIEFTGGISPSFNELGSMARLSGSATFCPASIVVQAAYTFPEKYLSEA